MKAALIFLALTSALTAIGQVGNGTTAEVPAQPLNRTTIRARVFYEDTGRPVKRTSVMLLNREMGAREVSGLTDAQGNLEIRDVMAGKYYAIVNAPGAVSPMAYVDFRKEPRKSFDDELAGFPTITVNGISDIDVQIPVRRGGAVSGRVTYSDGDTAIGVRVEILRKVEGELLPTISNFSAFASMISAGPTGFQTDDRGYYRFSGLPAGDYVVKVSENVAHGSDDVARGNRFETMLFGNGTMLTVFFENAFELDKAQTITVAFGQEIGEINIVIPERKLHTVTGKVISAKDKLPVRGATISLLLEDQNVDGGADRVGPSPQYAVSDEKGKWEFKELPAGKYKIVANPLDAEFDEAAQAYGNKPYDANVVRAVNTMSNAANAPANRMGEPAKRPRKFAKKVQELIIGDEAVAEQVIELKIGGTISGAISIDNSKAGSGGVTIVATNERDEISSSDRVHSYSYEDGQNGREQKFEIESVASGRTYLTIETEQDDYYVRSATAGGVDLLKDGFEVKDGEDLKNVKIVLASDTGVLKGTMLDADKQPAAGLQITLVPTDPSRSRNLGFHRRVRSDEKGEFEVRLPPIEYAILSIPPRAASKGRDHFYKWLAEAIKSARTFKIERGKTQEITIRRDDAKTGQ